MNLHYLIKITPGDIYVVRSAIPFTFWSTACFFHFESLFTFSVCISRNPYLITAINNFVMRPHNCQISISKQKQNKCEKKSATIYNVCVKCSRH